MMRWVNLLLLIPTLLLANPSGMEVVSGVASLERAAHELRVTVGDRAELNWRDFSIGPGEVTRFVQPNAQSFVLNRVVGGSQSAIHGLLEANGYLLLINPAGIVIGPHGTIRTAGFIASTLDVLQFDPKEMRFAGAGGEVVNCGQIDAFGGEVVLLGEVVKNYGTIRADGVRLGAGREIVLMSAGEQRLIIQPSLGDAFDGAAIDQQGRIEAIQAELRAGSNLYALAINHGGCIDALSTAEVDGRIFLVADGGWIEATGNLVAPGGTIHLLSDEILLAGEATIDVSGARGGGTALIGGDYHGANPEIPTASYLVVEEGVSIHADALEKGDGGKVILWGKNVCGCFGTVTAQGGPQGGDGGLIEVSGHGWYSIAGAPLSTFAPLGRNGTLSFDPVNVTISNNPNAGIATYPPRKYIFDGTASSWNVNASDLVGYLGANSIEVNTSLISGPDPGLAGNIDVNANVVWNTNSVLTLFADATLSINNGAIIENTASPPEPDIAIYLYADTLNVGGPGQTGASAVVAENKSIVVNAGTINVTGSTTSGSLTRINTVNQGNITINATGDLNITTPSVGSAQIKAENDNTLVVGGTINITGGPSTAQAELNATSGTLNATAEAINVTSGSFAGSLAHLGILTQGEVVLTTTAGLTVSSPDLGTAQVVSMGDMTLNIGNGLSLFAAGSGASATLEASSGTISGALTAGNFVVQAGNDASATTQPEAVVTASNIALLLPAGDHAIFGGSVGSATVTAAGDLSIVATAPGANFSVVAGQSTTGLSSAATLQTTGSGDLTLDLSTLTVQGNVPLSGSGGSNGLVQTESGAIKIILDDMLTLQPIAAGGEQSLIQTTSGGSITISGDQFDVAMGGVLGDGSQIKTVNGGSIQLGATLVPAGNVTISSLPAATASDPLSGLIAQGGGTIGVVARGDLSITAGANPTSHSGNAGIFVSSGTGDIAIACKTIAIQGGSSTGSGSSMAGIETVDGSLSTATSSFVTVTSGESSGYMSGTTTNMLVGGDLTVTAGSNQEAFIQGLQAVSIALGSGELRVQGGSDPGAVAGAGADIVVSSAGSGDLNISLPAGNHGCFGGAAGFAIIQNFGTGNLNIAGREPGCNFSIVAGQSSVTTGSEAQVNTFGGSIAMELASLTMRSNAPLAGGGYGGSSALIQSDRDINIVLSDSLSIAASVAGSSSTNIQTNSGGAISITGSQFDVEIGNGLTNTGHVIRTINGGAITLGTAMAPAGNISIECATFVDPAPSYFSTGLVTRVGGDISVVATGDLSITAPFNPAEVEVGVLAGYTSGIGNISVVAGNISIEGAPSMGSGSAPVGIATGLSGPTGTGNISVIGFGNLTVRGSALSLGALSQIGAMNGGDIDGVFFGTVELIGELGDGRIYTNSGSVNLIGGAFDLSGATAYIQSDGGGAMNLQARNSIALADGAFFSLVGPDSLTALAGTNFTFASGSFASVTGGGAMTLVCDNRFPAPPLVGPGEFNLSSTSQLNADGDVLIYTARRVQNSIASGQTINGSPFVPGPIFVNSDTEQWVVYYPGGTPPMGSFKIYYKSAPVTIPNYFQNVAAIVGEFFDQMNWFVDTVDQPTFPYRYPLSLFEVSGI